MGNYKRDIDKSNSKSHPIWRGIGCMMLILVPLMAFAAADTLYDSYVVSGLQMFGQTIFARSTDLTKLYFSYNLWGDTNFRISLFHLAFMFVFSIIGFAVFSFIYALAYRITGPPKYGPKDAPPPRRSKRRR